MLQRITIVSLLFATGLSITAMDQNNLKYHFYDGMKEKKNLVYSDRVLNFRIPKKRQVPEEKFPLTKEDAKSENKRAMQEAKKMTINFKLPVLVAQNNPKKSNVQSTPSVTHIQEIREEHHEPMASIPDKSSDLLKMTDGMSAKLLLDSLNNQL